MGIGSENPIIQCRKGNILLVDLYTIVGTSVFNLDNFLFNTFCNVSTEMNVFE